VLTVFLRRCRPVAAAVVSIFLFLAGHGALALSDQGVIYIEMTSGSGSSTSQARWEIGGVVQMPYQTLAQVNPCNLVTNTDLLSFSAAAGTASAKQDAIGVDYINGAGVNCAGIDTKGNSHEALTITLGDRPAALGLRFTKLVLQLELKGTEVVTEIAVNDSISGVPTEYWEVRGGASIDPSDPGRDPSDFTNPNRIIDCLGGGSDVAPDARDTCIVVISTFGNSFTVKSMKGSTSLEGGRSLPGYTEIHLTDADGIYDCGDTITSTSLTEGGVEVARAECRRLETNLINCPSSTQCIAVPADIYFEQGGTALNLEYDEGDQCVAVQCQIAFAPYELGAAITANSSPLQTGRTTTALAATVDGSGNITDKYPKLGIETIYLQPPVVQFFPSDPKYYVQHCLEELKRHPVVELSGVTGEFVAGQIITNLNTAATAKVISYQVVDGVSSLVYYVADGSVFSVNDMIQGPSGDATIASDPAPSSFIEELVGTSLNPAGAGYALLDYSAKINVQGVQHACLRALTSELTGFKADGSTTNAEDWIRILIDTYLQGDIRLSVSDR